MSMVEYQLTNSVAEIRLNRPERLNAVVPQLVEEMCDALEQAGSDGVGVVILSGEGRAFCAGHDLQADEATQEPMQLRRQMQRIQDVTRLVRRLPCPVLASVHGYALGAGCEFALCSDLVIAAHSSRFGFPEVGVGLSVTGGISHILPTAVGLARAKELLLLGEQFTATQAADWGLVNRVVPDVLLDDESARLAEQLMSQPRHAASLAKQVLDTGAEGDLEAALEMEIRHAQLTMTSAEASTAARAFRGRTRAANGEASQ